MKSSSQADPHTRFLVFLTTILAFITLFIASIMYAMPSKPAYADDVYSVDVNVTYGQTEARKQLDMVNSFRKEADVWYWNEDNSTKTICNGLGELQYDYGLERIAMQRAAEIALYNAHVRPNNTQWNSYVKSEYTSNTGRSYTSAAENIACGYINSAKVFDGWREELENYSGQGHRRNMLSSSVTSVGFGHVFYNGIHYWVQEFGSPALDTTATAANDSQTTVTVQVASSLIDSITVVPAQESFSLKCGEAATMSSLNRIHTLKIWPNSYTAPVTADTTYISSNPSIASVSGTRLTAISPGSATVTATSMGRSADIQITVSHDMVKTLTRAATCSMEGEYKYTCSGCGYSYTEAIEKTAHAFGSWTTTSSPTCVTEGIETRTCSSCGASESKTLATISHNYGAWSVVRAATCTSKGTEESVCSMCGDRKTRDIATIDHNYGAWNVTRAATCTSTGTEESTCSMCETKKTREVAKIDHNYGAWTISKAATCTATGTEESACSMCGTKHTRSIAAKGHSFGAWSTTKSATCTAAGTQTRTCPACGKIESRSISSLGHKFGAWTTALQPTCTKAGTKARTCSTCKARQTQSIAATGHSWSAYTPNQATGFLVRACSKCGNSENGASMTLPALSAKASFTVKFAKLKKNAQSINLAGKSSSGATVAYKISIKDNKTKKFKKYFKLVADGKIQIKKKLKKGIYKIDVEYLAPSAGTYFPLQVTKTVTIKVK